MLQKNYLLSLLLFILIAVNPTVGQHTDTAQINRLIERSKNHLFSEPSTAIMISDTIFQKSSEIDYQYGKYIAHSYKGIANFMSGHFTESIENYQDALPLANKEIPYETLRLYMNIGLALNSLNLHDSAISYSELVCEQALAHELFEVYEQSVLDLAITYLNKTDYIKAYSYYTDVENYIEENSDQDFLIKAYSALAMFYYRVENYDVSRDHYKNAIAIDIYNDDFNFLSENYGNLGLLYQDIHQYDSAIYYYNKSINSADEFKKEMIEVRAYINIGNTYLDRYILDSAFIFYEKAMNDSILEKFPESKAAIYTNLGMLNLRQENYAKARYYLIEGLSLSKDYELLQFQKNAYRELSVLDSIQGNHLEALFNYKKYHQLYDSLKLIETNKHIAISELEKYIAKEKYNNQLLLKENKNQNQQIIIQRTIIAIAILVVLVLVIITSLVFKNRKKINNLNNQLKNSNSNLEELNKDLKLQKNEMKELLMSKDRFVSILGHDLKNPFTGLLGLLELIQQDWDEIDEQEKKDGIKQLHQSSITTYQLLEELLDWGKTQQGLIKPRNSRIQVLEIFQNVENLFHLQLKEKNITVDIQASQNNYIETDKKLLSQIIQNLFGNAIKYSHANSEISLLVVEDNKELKICIKDSGIGIPEDKIDSLFNLDKHFNRPGTQNEKSTGMGLILCKEYAHIIEAQISVESKENSGSTFCLVFPKIK